MCKIENKYIQYVSMSSEDNCDMYSLESYVHIGRHNDVKSFSKFVIRSDTTVDSLLLAYFERTGNLCMRLYYCGLELVGTIHVPHGSVIIAE